MPYIAYEVEIVGGPYDGAGGLPSWRDEGELPPPPAILVGWCRGDGQCGMQGARCRHGHVAFWTEEEDERPARTVPYELESAEADAARGTGRALYAIGGLRDLPGGDTRRELPQPAGVGAGPRALDGEPLT